nr:hypothetical protein KitaXyl93_56100 [Kitasatospora sp. Xyl93]
MAPRRAEPRGVPVPGNSADGPVFPEVLVPESAIANSAPAFTDPAVPLGLFRSGCAVPAIPFRRFRLGYSVPPTDSTIALAAPAGVS